MAGFYPRLLAWPGSGPHALAYALGFTSGKEAARTTPRRCYTTARPVNKINKKKQGKKVEREADHLHFLLLLWSKTFLVIFLMRIGAMLVAGQQNVGKKNRISSINLITSLYPPTCCYCFSRSPVDPESQIYQGNWFHFLFIYSNGSLARSRQNGFPL